MAAIEYFLIAGATGRQGGATVDALLTHPDIKIKPKQVYALTRQASGSGAVKLREKYGDINIVAGDLSNPEAILQQLDKTILPKTGIFLAQAHGPTEVSDAKGLIDSAARNGIPYFVYSSVDRGGRELSDKDPSYCKTFSDKFLIEKHLIDTCSNSKMDYTILRPTWFADNAWWGFLG
ncbi:nucleoside diphosphate sugar epimerase [Fusarium globosum]|uniref:Nucleoside diphosphate sugar epimerase n=1 Tax=Fusarium globosum TaxID=78864 RepID=A0A8H6D190_9HYPO|nr:nucleoside diphosphate sugar epimerase [Fusarium globosum]